MQPVGVKVLKKEKMNDTVYRITVKAPRIGREAEPGQFLYVKCSSTLDPFLRRPFSINKVEGDNVSIMFKIIGKGTRLLAGIKQGDELDVMGPLGNGFPIEKSFKRAVVVGGGIGAAPLLYLMQYLKNLGIEGDVIIGAPDARSLLCVEEFERLGKVLCATEDGSMGIKGLPTRILEERLTHIRYDVIYTCGPRVMMQAVKQLGAGFNTPVFVSLEERMGCGIGACLGCVCKSEKGYMKVCKDGPVFNAGEVVLE